MQPNGDSGDGPINKHNQANRVVGAWSVLNHLREINKPAYNLLILGMAAFAVVSIVAKWQKEFDFQLMVSTIPVDPLGPRATTGRHRRPRTSDTLVVRTFLRSTDAARGVAPGG
jgi:hypothetical protein